MKLRRYFKRIKIPGPTPWPIIGNFFSLIKKGLTTHDEELMTEYGRVVGYFEGSTPNLMITDVKLIRAALIKDFNNFVNRRVIL